MPTTRQSAQVREHSDAFLFSRPTDKHQQDMTTLSAKQHFFTITKGWSTAKILTAMGVINNILYCVVKGSGALLRVKTKKAKESEDGKKSRSPAQEKHNTVIDWLNIFKRARFAIHSQLTA